MGPMQLQAYNAHTTRSDHPGDRTSAIRATAFGVTTLVLLVLLLGLSGRGRPATVDAPQPLPAPDAAIVTGMDFPEQARPWGACAALVEHSAAIDNARSDRANELTSVLYQDACLGA